MKKWQWMWYTEDPFGRKRTGVKRNFYAAFWVIFIASFSKNVVAVGVEKINSYEYVFGRTR